MFVAAYTRENTASMTREHKFLGRNQENLRVEEFRCDSILQSEKRRERLQGIVEDASSAPRLASSSAESLLGRNECPGTHGSFIEQEEREDSSCQRV